MYVYVMNASYEKKKKKQALYTKLHYNGMKKKCINNIFNIQIYHTPALVATEECLLGTLPGSTRCKALLGRWHLSARVSRVWHSSPRRAIRTRKPANGYF